MLPMYQDTQKYDFILPGFGSFIASLFLLFSGQWFPEYAESGLLTGFGFILFFLTLAYIYYNCMKLVVT